MGKELQAALTLAALAAHCGAQTLLVHTRRGVHRVPTEDCVAAAVAGELGGVAQIETLKATAVVVRTYFRVQAGRYRKEGFDFVPRRSVSAWIFPPDPLQSGRPGPKPKEFSSGGRDCQPWFFTPPIAGAGRPQQAKSGPGSNGRIWFPGKIPGASARPPRPGERAWHGRAWKRRSACPGCVPLRSATAQLPGASWCCVPTVARWIRNSFTWLSAGPWAGTCCAAAFTRLHPLRRA